MLTVFNASIVNGEIEIDSNPADEKIIDYSWFDLAEIKELELGEGVQRFFENYLY